MSEVAKLEKTLRKQVASGDVEPSKMASTAERILGLDPRNGYAMQCKSVALLHAGRFAAALRVMEDLEREKTPAKSSSTFLFHKAYCHYRLSQYVEAKAALRRQPGGTARIEARHLLAQIHYNLEEYAEAANMYASILKDKAYADNVERQEVLTNYTAALTAVDPSRVAAVVRDAAKEKTPDLLFNLAAAQLEAKEYDAASASLLQAEQLCARDFPKSRLRSLAAALAAEPAALQAQLGVPLIASSTVDTTATAERLFFNEVSNNWMQQAYLLFLHHNEAAARRVVELILTYKPSSTVTTAVASILWTALQRGSDFFDSHRKLKAAQHVKVVSRLTSRQSIAVHYNTALLHLGAGALDRCARAVEQMEKANSGSELTQSLRLVLAVRELKKKKTPSSTAAQPASMEGASAVQACVQRYETEVAERDKAATAEDVAKRHRFLQRIAAQLLLEQGYPAQAAAALEVMDDAEFVRLPAMVLTLAAWKAQSGDVDGAMMLLQQRLTEADSEYTTAIKKAMLAWAVQDLAAPRGLYAQVATVVKAVSAADASLATDRQLAALLVVCLAQTDIAEAKRQVATVDAAAAAAMSRSGTAGSVAFSDAEVEVRVRQNPGLATMNELGYRRVTAVDQEAAATANGGNRPRRRRRAMRRPAKNKEGKPDPERWIPMSVRSYITDLPERRKKELRRLRAIEQDQKRRTATAARQAKATEKTEAAE